MKLDTDRQAFGEGGLKLVAANTALPAGEYCAISFVGGGGDITTSFSAAEASLISGTQTGITFPDGYVLYTPLSIAAGSAARISCPVVLYTAL
jgi:hypothetical protein